jgi:hypothetical protein
MGRSILVKREHQRQTAPFWRSAGADAEFFIPDSCRDLSGSEVGLFMIVASSSVRDYVICWLDLR